MSGRSVNRQSHSTPASMRRVDASGYPPTGVMIEGIKNLGDALKARNLPPAEPDMKSAAVSPTIDDMVVYKGQVNGKDIPIVGVQDKCWSGKALMLYSVAVKFGQPQEGWDMNSPIRGEIDVPLSEVKTGKNAPTNTYLVVADDVLPNCPGVVTPYRAAASRAV